jgi:hypothetical protein
MTTRKKRGLREGIAVKGMEPMRVEILRNKHYYMPLHSPLIGL